MSNLILAFGIGFFASLHCIGMCGPIALGISGFAPVNTLAMTIHSLKYNLGRIIGYVILGLGIGAIGSLISIVQMQKTVSILSGLILLILLLFSLDLESFLMKSNRFSSFYQRVFAGLSGRLSTLAHTRPLILGIANGFLPCGLVYLALAASLSTGSIFGGAIFMTLFGLGTLPAMLSFGLGGGQLLSRKLPSFRKYILPAMQLVLGLYLIARGMNIPFPATLDFDQALRNPVMCH